MRAFLFYLYEKISSNIPADPAVQLLLWTKAI